MKANIGDTVTFEISTGKVIKAASIAYVFPAITMIAGYFLGEKLLGLSENQSIIASFLALVVSFIVLYLYDKFIVKKQTNSEIEIISIEKEDTSTILNSCENKNIW